MAKLIKGVNDLATVNPELAKQWHPIKNGDLKPDNIGIYSSKNVWWLYSYDDPITHKHFDFEWQATIVNRNKMIGCPYLSNRKILVGFNDLATTNPELAKEWHPTKNGELKPTDVTAGSLKKVWWFLPYDDSKTGKHFDFEWQAQIGSRNKGCGCPFLTNKALWTGFNDLATVNPELAKEWHPTKNGELRPTDVTAGSQKKVWWFLPYDDSKTGKHFDFEWQAQIGSRNSGMKCPFLSSQALWTGFNDLATVNPELAKQWHPTKNGNLKPEDVSVNSITNVWWLYPYDDPVTGKHFDFEWISNVHNRNYGNGCPYLPTATNPKLLVGFNDLATTHPNLAKEWHPTKNGNLKPTNVLAGSGKKVWWYLPYDDPITGKHFDFEWRTSIYSRKYGNGCPFLTSSKTEILLYAFLKKENMAFKAEKTFLNCRDKHPLPFDIYLLNENLIIECDGIQHFKAIEYFGSKEDLKIRKFHDNIKNEFCKENDIPILRLPYIYSSIADKQKIENFVLDFIKTKIVPQEILHFYSNYKSNNYVKCAMELNNKNLKL